MIFCCTSYRINNRPNNEVNSIADIMAVFLLSLLATNIVEMKPIHYANPITNIEIPKLYPIFYIDP
jgi:hypothetical protein